MLLSSPDRPHRNMARFYRLDVQPDLFGGWSFIWGLRPHRAAGPGVQHPLPFTGRGPCRPGAPAAGEERRGYRN